MRRRSFLRRRRLHLINRVCPSPRVLAALIFVVSLPVLAIAQAGSVDPTIQSLRRDMDEMIKGQIELQKQVQDLKTLLQGNQARAQTPAKDIVFDISGSPIQGDAKAPVTMIEFSDFSCPFSGKYNNETRPQIDQNYVSTGKVRYVFCDFPLQSLHPFAHRISEGAHCAFDQKQFWLIRSVFFAHQTALTTDDALMAAAKEAQLNLETFGQCLRSQSHAAGINQEVAQASANGVTGTPTFFFGLTDPAGKIKVTKVIVGHQPYENFKQTLDSLLSDKNPQKL